MESVEQMDDIASLTVLRIRKEEYDRPIPGEPGEPRVPPANVDR
jgi:hypothetical protein